MNRSRTNPFVVILLLLMLILTGVSILWVGVNTISEKQFGTSSRALTPVQRWSYGLRLLVNENALLQPVSSIESSVTFTIPSGASVSKIALDLQENGLITSWEAFRFYVIYKGLDTQLKAGDFQLSPSLTTVEIANALLSTYKEEVSFYIYPGWRAEEVAAALPTSGIQVTPDEFLKVVQNPHTLDLPLPLQGIPSLEGFLFPGSYVIKRQISAQDLALTFVNRFMEAVPQDFQLNLQSQGLNLYEAITLASIIQRETFEDSERAQMASVFYNRLTAGMKLETDPTVQYALGYNDQWGGWWKTPLSLSDLKTPSAFNTYLIDGLPPQPISNADLPAIQAVASPSDTPYFYFRANCDGSGTHVFSKTYEEHLSNVCQ